MSSNKIRVNSYETSIEKRDIDFILLILVEHPSDYDRSL